MKELKNLKIIYIEDDLEQQENVVEFLSYYDIDTQVALDAESGFMLYTELKPDILIIDIKLPKMNGIELIEKIRQKDSNIPIIVLSGFSDPVFTLKAVELNITRYLIKPISEYDITSAIKKAAKTLQAKPTDNKKIKLSKHSHFSTDDRILYKDGVEVKISKKELLFLELLIHFHNQIISYDLLQESIWSDKPMTDNAVRTLVKNLRNKVSDLEIINISGLGYKLIIPK